MSHTSCAQCHARIDTRQKRLRLVLVEQNPRNASQEHQQVLKTYCQQCYPQILSVSE